MAFEVREVLGVSGSLRAVFEHHAGADSTALLLPGGLGGWAVPALYYPQVALVEEGFDVLSLDSAYRERPGLDVLKGDARAALAAASGPALVGGKSLGTLQLAELLLDGDLGLDIPTLWLTPLLGQGRVADALAALKTPGLVVIGTRDPLYADEMPESLAKAGHRVVVIPDADHGLRIVESAERTAAVASRLVAEVKEYAAWSRRATPAARRSRRPPAPPAAASSGRGARSAGPARRAGSRGPAPPPAGRPRS